ncbi:MAG: hypothetical protein DI600_06055 [Cutibacterium granulosum]|nr:MAG: hypothetical protein DI600_06055 [Cutibacterium granulosum]
MVPVIPISPHRRRHAAIGRGVVARPSTWSWLQIEPVARIHPARREKHAHIPMLDGHHADSDR